MSSGSGRRFSQELDLGLQRVDVDRGGLRLDQYEDHFRCSVLCYCNSHWSVEAMVGKRSHGPAVETRPRQLSHYPQATARVPSNEAVLESQLAVSGKQSSVSI